MNLIKKFFDWIKIKANTHHSEYKRPEFSEGEVWWCQVGENVGSEMSGKGKKFTRPVLIIKKLSKNLFIALPTSTKKQRLEWLAIHVSIRGTQTSGILSQIRTLDSKRLETRIGTLDQRTLINAKRAVMALFFVSPPYS